MNKHRERVFWDMAFTPDVKIFAELVVFHFPHITLLFNQAEI